MTSGCYLETMFVVMPKGCVAKCLAQNAPPRPKFVLSPPGLGLDAYRTWQALYFGRIPIVGPAEGEGGCAPQCVGSTGGTTFLQPQPPAPAPPQTCRPACTRTCRCCRCRIGGCCPCHCLLPATHIPPRRLFLFFQVSDWFCALDPPPGGVVQKWPKVAHPELLCL